MIVDDNANDVALLQFACAKASLTCPLKIVRDGAKAIQYLAGEGQFADRREFPLPRLVLLDLKMPLCDGFEVLSWTRAQPGLRRLAVVVLTSSAEPQDIDWAYDLGANSYTVKPNSPDELAALAGRVKDWWLGPNQLPRLEITTDQQPMGTDGG